MMRQAARAILVVLATPGVVVGAWAELAPGSFYPTFPLGHWRWLTRLGPYNEHLVRDFGGLNLSLAVLTLAAAIALTRGLLITTAIAWEVYSIPHLTFHLLHPIPIPALQAGLNLVALAGAVVGPPVALLLGAASQTEAQRDPRTPRRPLEERTQRDETS